MYHFLIVDDVKIIRDAICVEIAQKYPMLKLIAAANGQEALAIMEHEEIDCVLTDIKMPVCDGLKLIRILRNDKKYKNPIIILSGYEEFDYAKEAISYGVMDYLLKPIEAEELQRQIKRALEQIGGTQKGFILNTAQTKRLRHYLVAQNYQALTQMLEAETIMGGWRCWQSGSSIIQSIAAEISRIYDLEYAEVLEKIDITREDLLTVDDRSILIRAEVDSIVVYLKEKGLFKEEIGIVTCIQNYIDENYDKDVKVKELAEQYHVNYAYLSTLFAKITGEGLSSYLTKVRIEHAKLMLKESDMTMIHIAVAVGYDDVQYFHRVFKKITGITPSEYKKTQRISNKPQ